MQKRTTLLIWVAAMAASAVLLSGCGRASASGKLQIMYSGNIKGNVSPCG